MASYGRSSLPFATFFFHNAVLDRKLVLTDRSMVCLPCLHVTGHSPFASGANVHIRFFLHNAVLHRKLGPTHRSMVYLPYTPFDGLFTPLKLAKAFGNAQPRRHKLFQGQIHRFFWAVQELPQGQILRLPFAKPSQPTGTPRPHQWLLMGVQACRLPAPKRLKRLKSLKSLKRWKPLKLCQSKASSIAFSGRCKSYLTARSIASSKRGPCQQAPQGHINGFFWASKPAVCQPQNAYNA